MRRHRFFVLGAILLGGGVANASVASPFGPSCPAGSTAGTDGPIVGPRDMKAALLVTSPPNDKIDLGTVSDFDLVNVQYPSGYSSADIVGVTITQDPTTGVMLAQLYLGGDDSQSANTAASGTGCGDALPTASKVKKPPVTISTGVTNTRTETSPSWGFSFHFGFISGHLNSKTVTTTSVSGGKTNGK